VIGVFAGTIGIRVVCSVIKWYLNYPHPKLEMGTPLASLLGIGIQFKLDLKKLMKDLKIPVLKMQGYL